MKYSLKLYKIFKGVSVIAADDAWKTTGQSVKNWRLNWRLNQ